MNKYQQKRVLGCLRREEKLTAEEKKILKRLARKQAVSWGSKDPAYLTEAENSFLNRLAQRVGG